MEWRGEERKGRAKEAKVLCKGSEKGVRERKAGGERKNGKGREREREQGLEGWKVINFSLLFLTFCAAAD